MTITIKEGRFVGEVQIDPKTEGKWMWTIHECLFPGNKHADPDFETFEHPGRYYFKSSAITHCLQEIEARIAADKKRAESAPAGGNEYDPFEVKA